MKSKIIVILCLLASVYAKAQVSHYEAFSSIIVKENNDTLAFPFAGGINIPQFSAVDLNMDGIKDLVTFDRDGSKITCYLNGGTPGKIDYTHVPLLSKKFPPISDWMLMRDYDGDGKEDIFAATSGGVQIYKNVSTLADGLKFQQVSKSVYANFGTFKAPIYNGRNDIPTIVDVDLDGDLDILAFELGIDTAGDGIYWYKNTSQELYGTSDSLKYVVEKRCWGRFRESYTSCFISLQYPFGDCGTGDKPDFSMYTKDSFEQMMREQIAQRDGRHSGSTTVVFDANGDGKLDVLIGDISCKNMYMLINTNTNAEPIFTSVEYHYPANDPISLQVFPAAYFVDINNDGKRDLIAAPNASGDADNFQNILLFINNGTDASPLFELTTNSFFEGDMIKVGEGATPHFFDYDHDGKLDMLIGNFGYWISPATYTSSLALYKNIGTANSPAFELVTRDFCGLGQYNIKGMFPTTGDLDKDGDDDLIIGADDGQLYYFKNNAPQGSPANFQLAEPFFQNIDIGSVSTPQLVDVNKDGKLDLLIGERFTNVNYFLDTGLVSGTPAYKLFTDSLGKITYRRTNYLHENSSVFFGEIDEYAGNDIAVGNTDGKIYFYMNVGTNMKAKFIVTDSVETGLGQNIRITMADLDNDLKKELIVTTLSGGVSIFKISFLFVGINKSESFNTNYSLYPNPVQESLTIQANSVNQVEIKSIEIYDLMGRLIKEIHDINTEQTKIDVSSYAAGNYILKIKDNQSISTSKFTVIR